MGRGLLCPVVPLVCVFTFSSAEPISDVQRPSQRRLRHARKHRRRQVLCRSVLRQRLRHREVVDTGQRCTEYRFVQ